jgi:hypothetical protein
MNPKYELPATDAEMRILAMSIADDAVRSHEQIEEYDEIAIDITRQISYGITSVQRLPTLLRLTASWSRPSQL